MDLAMRIKGWFDGETEFQGPMGSLKDVLICPEIVDISKSNEEAIAISVNAPRGVLNYGGSVGEREQGLTIVSVARSHTRAIEIEEVILRLETFAGWLPSVPTNSMQMMNYLNVLGLFFVNSARTYLEYNLIQSTYNFNAIVVMGSTNNGD